MEGEVLKRQLRRYAIGLAEPLAPEPDPKHRCRLNASMSDRALTVNRLTPGTIGEYDDSRVTQQASLSIPNDQRIDVRASLR